MDNSIKVQFKSKLKKCLENPHIQSNKLRDFDCAYKIKLRSAGYRLVYEVDDQEIVVFVIAVGKRENNEVYNKAKNAVSRIRR
ncbi:type II toxin-antitoxin system RelE family toxin [Methylocucumis oryzae]|uniref:type II toxin-antitoxin system RelE family toxin n=1 Tax=Methylocucumis oryzae TaxID=1632867 RepID=UPI000A765C4D|nr:type II toxin-antitoxin system RelE/ParE family toxin [Methylocucumis oryzae]